MLNLKSQLRKVCEQELHNIGESGDFFMERKSGGKYVAWFASKEKMICAFVEYKASEWRICFKFFAPVLF